jgi:hypothetical protein
VKSKGGVSENAINGVSQSNPTVKEYEDQAKKLWGIP